MPVVEYKLHKLDARSNSMTVPIWIDDGGYWKHPTDHTMVGWVLPESEREWYLPDTLTELNRADFITRMKAIHAIEPMYTEVEYTDPPTEPRVMTEAEVETLAGDWFDNFHSE